MEEKEEWILEELVQFQLPQKKYRFYRYIVLIVDLVFLQKNLIPIVILTNSLILLGIPLLFGIRGGASW